MRRTLMPLLASMPGAAMAAPALEVPPEARDPHPSDHALVVAVPDYFVLPDAPGATADAEAVRATLVHTRGVPEDQVTSLLEGASRERILSAAKDVGERTGPGGTAWLYFAGHGALDGGSLHVLGVDAQPESAAWLPRSLSLEELAGALAKGGGRPVLWIDAGSGPQGRGHEALLATSANDDPSTSELEVPEGSIVWTHAPGAPAFTLGDHGAFTYLSVGALRGWADGHGGQQPDGSITPGEAQAWAADQARALDMPPPQLHGDTTGLAWATGVQVDKPDLSPNDVRRPDGDGAPSDGPIDAAASAESILADARGSLRQLAVGLGGDVALERDEVETGRVRGKAEDAELAPALAQHLEAILPADVTAARFAAFTSRPPLAAPEVTVNIDLERRGEQESFLVEGIALPSSTNWPATAERIGRRLIDQLSSDVPENSDRVEDDAN